MLEGKKTCSKCGFYKSIHDFSKDKTKHDLLRSVCKRCDATRYSVDKERIKKVSKKYYAEHRNERIEYSATYRKDNREQVLSYLRDYQKKNLEEYRIRNHTRRAAIRLSGGKLSNNIVQILLEKQKGKCPCCQRPLGHNYHIDHIMPLALGGTNTDDNIQLLRSSCNISKNAKHPVEYMQQRGFLL